jgi:heat shock protein HtpX
MAGIMMGSIVLMSEVFLRSMWFSSATRYGSSKDKGQGQVIIMIIAIVLAILAPILAQLLYFSISRKREYLADASAVRLTRYPEGLASALEKISGSTADLQVANKVTAPMYIANPLKPKGQKLSNLTSTHPPIQDRIKILRNMAGGAGYNDYQSAYAKVSGTSSSIIPSSSLAAVENIGLREAGATGKSAGDIRRNTGDIMMMTNQYNFVNCNCGIRIKIPPEFKQNSFKCPKCGQIHKLKPK